MHQLLQWLALPQFGLSTVFIVALVSATLLPLGSEPAVAGLLQLNPDLFWQAILVATAGNTLGGAISWWTGMLAHKAWRKARSLRHAQDYAQDPKQESTAPPEKAPHQRSRQQRTGRDARPPAGQPRVGPLPAGQPAGAEGSAHRTGRGAHGTSFHSPLSSFTTTRERSSEP